MGYVARTNYKFTDQYKLDKSVIDSELGEFRSEGGRSQSIFIKSMSTKSGYDWCQLIYHHGSLVDGGGSAGNITLFLSYERPMTQ